MTEAMKALRMELYSPNSPVRPVEVTVHQTRHDRLSVKCRYKANENPDKYLDCANFVKSCVREYLQRQKWWKQPKISVEIGMYINRLIWVNEL